MRKLFGGWEEGDEVAITRSLTIKASRFTTQIKTDEKTKEKKKITSEGEIFNSPDLSLSFSKCLALF